MCWTYGAYIAFILRSIAQPWHHTGTVSELSAKLMIAFISSEFSGCIMSYHKTHLGQYAWQSHENKGNTGDRYRKIFAIFLDGISYYHIKTADASYERTNAEYALNPP